MLFSLIVWLFIAFGVEYFQMKSIFECFMYLVLRNRKITTLGWLSGV